MGKGMWTVVVLAMVAAGGCRLAPEAACPVVGETRCMAEVAQACDPHRRWQPLLDCRRVSQLTRAPFVCAPVVLEDDEVGRLPGHTCVPAALAADAGAAGGDQ